jgi:hypothetical protein
LHASRAGFWDDYGDWFIFIDGKACFAQVRLRLSKMSQLLKDDMLTRLLMSLAKAMGPERVSLWREQRSVRQRRTAAASMELATAAGYIDEHEACCSSGPQRRATSTNMEHATVAGYIGARRAMKADFGCGVLL